MLKNLKQEGYKVRMTHEEKAAMRALLRARFGGHAAPTPSPYSPWLGLRSFSVVGFSYQARMAMAGLLAFVLVGSGTASAAQGALPGDLLYPVKISINEKVEEALAPSVSARAEVAVKLAERRVEEAQALAARGSLAVAVAEELAANFDVHAAQAEELSAQVEEEDPGTAERVKAKLATSLSANGAILKKLGRDSNNKNNEEQSEVFATRVIARAEGPARIAMEARSFSVATKAAPAALLPADPAAGAEATLMQSADAQNAVDMKAQKRAGALQEKAAEALEDVREELEAWTGDAETVEQVGKELAAADTHMAAGASLVGATDYAAAREEFARALKLAVRLEALIKADQKFNNGILKALINAEDGEVQGAQVEILIPEPAIRVDLGN